MDSSSAKVKRVCVIGGGAAGMAAAWSLSRFPERFYVELWEKQPYTGGVATSFELPPTSDNHDHHDPKGKTIEEGELHLWINDGVQGGTSSYRNSILLFQQMGFEVSPVKMKISFGKGPTAWNNYTPIKKEIVQRLQKEIESFESTIQWINRFEKAFICVPIAKVLKLFGYSDEFSHYMVFPLVALFFGTGNQTPSVSAAIIARVFLDPDLRLFDYCKERLLSQTPDMFAFPKLGEVYAVLGGTMGERLRLGKAVTKVVRSAQGVEVVDEDGKSTHFDEVVFACDAETALKLLDYPSRWEQFTLGNVTYYDDITVTHEDLDYMQKHYEVDLENGDQYFVRNDTHDPQKIEMSFNLSKYQPQLLKAPHRNIFQSIFLDKTQSALWTINEINPNKVLLKKWWRQFAHTWKHFASVVPFVRFIQNQNQSWYCGAYTLMNTHEIAVISGLAVAHRLGATYPFMEDPLAKKQFNTYLSYIHGVQPI